VSVCPLHCTWNTASRKAYTYCRHSSWKLWLTGVLSEVKTTKILTRFLCSYLLCCDYVCKRRTNWHTPSWQQWSSQYRDQNHVVLERLNRHQSTQPLITGKQLRVTMATSVNSSSSSRHYLIATPEDSRPRFVKDQRTVRCLSGVDYWYFNNNIQGGPKM